MPVVYIDGDACPVKAEIESIVARHKIHGILVSNGGVRSNSYPFLQMITVPATKDAADNWIADRVVSGDVVVTDDIHLAARCIANQAIALKTDGRKLTEENIGGILASRDLMAYIRSSSPYFISKAKQFKKSHRARFVDALETLLRKSKM